MKDMLDQVTSVDLLSFGGPRRLISLGYYDGTTNGLLSFEQSGLAFRYELVSWDSGEDWRVFCLSPLIQSDFGAAVQVLSVLGEPRWPCWFPHWEFTSDAQKLDVEQALEAILNRSGPYRMAVLSRDLCASIKAAVNVIAGPGGAVEQFTRDRQIQPYEKWLPLFGVNAVKDPQRGCS